MCVNVLLKSLRSGGEGLCCQEKLHQSGTKTAAPQVVSCTGDYGDDDHKDW